MPRPRRASFVLRPAPPPVWAPLTATWGERRAEVVALWETQGFLQRVAGTEGQAPERIAEAVRFVLEQPPDSMIDVVNVRARPAR